MKCLWVSFFPLRLNETRWLRRWRAAPSAYQWVRRRWRKAEWKPRSGSWCQRAPRWTGTHNLWPPSHSPLRCPRRWPTFDPADKTRCRWSLIWKLVYFSSFKHSSHTQDSHLFPTKVKVEVLEISEAFAGEAWAAQWAGHVGKRGEVVAQHVVPPRLHVQLAVAVTSCVVLEVKAFRPSSFITGATSD